ncbi:MAG TPA: ankyrin repeat domain-containing protein [Fimbriimonas sp.]|nr:ankyrin repeat domain-containing protein [Fimbriimonas sp.]
MSSIDPEEDAVDRMIKMLEDPENVDFSSPEFQDLMAQVTKKSESYVEPSDLANLIKSGNVEAVKQQVAAGESLLYNRGGYTALLDAAYGSNKNEDIQMLNYLLSQGVPYPEPTSYRETPLSVLAHWGHSKSVSLLLEHGAPYAELEFTPLHHAVMFGTSEDSVFETDVRRLLEQKDRWSRTPLMLALQLGKVQMAKFLVSRGAQTNARDHVGHSGLFMAAESGNLEAVMYAIELGMSPVSTGKYSSHVINSVHFNLKPEVLTFLLDYFKGSDNWDNILSRALNEEDDPSILRLFLDAGVAGSEICAEGKRALLHPKFNRADLFDDISKEVFLEQSERRFGTQNPELIDNKFWNRMIESRARAYRARDHFGLTYDDPPVWCCSRFGQTLTYLADGRVIEIAGEHEDSYDPDFCIYNDVVVHESDGSFRLFGYPEEVFPPTDFHTATLVDGWIYIIGNLGYCDVRHGNCQVFRLSVETFEMERIYATGIAPGFLCRHRARLLPEGVIQISGGQVWNGNDLHSNEKSFFFDTKTYFWIVES